MSKRRNEAPSYNGRPTHPIRLAIIAAGFVAFSATAIDYAFAQTAADTQETTQQAPRTQNERSGQAPAEATPNPAGADVGEQQAVEPALVTPEEPASVEAKLATISELAKKLDNLQHRIQAAKESDAELARLRLEIDGPAAEALTARDRLKPHFEDISALLAKLGEKPKDSAQPEAPEIAAERELLEKRAARIEGTITAANLIITRAEQLKDRIQILRKRLFADALFTRTAHSPLSPATWKNVAALLPDACHQLKAMISDVLARSRFVVPWIAFVLLLSIGVYGALRVVRSQLISARDERAENTAPRFLERAGAAGWSIPAHASPRLGAAAVLYYGLNNLNLFYLQTGEVAWAAFIAVLIFIAVTSLARAILTPRRADWRVIRMPDQAARRLYLIIQGLAAVYSIDMFLSILTDTLHFPFPISVVQAFIASLAIVGLIFAFLRTSLSAPAPGTGQTAIPLSWRPLWLKPPLFFAAIAIAAAALFGYVALARFIAGQVIITGSIAVLIILMHLAIRSICGISDRATATSPEAGATPDQAAQQPARKVERPRLVPTLLENRLGLKDGQTQFVSSAIAVLLNILLAVLALPLLAYSLGFTTPDILNWAHNAVFGFQVAGVNISAARILAAILLFIAVLFLTRLVQRWLRATLMQSTRTDPGIAHSIITAVGYAGFAIAALIAISYGGLDVTNLAIVAGALSVGIGFGLQSIVNNFVSGLILLVERPIKVGDWIKVSDLQGHVRRISVRSTEIETFDRASVIVPNSDLITGVVTNLTHRNALGRLIIPVGVSYSTDPVRVREILQKIADDSPLILRHPAPVVAFDNLGDSALEFTMRVYISDINKSLSTQTELRTAIVQEFQKEGIEIPFPQTDVHLRDLDGVKEFAMRVMEERARQRGQKGPSAKEAAKPADEPSQAAPAARPAPPTIRGGRHGDGSDGDGGGDGPA